MSRNTALPPGPVGPVGHVDSATVAQVIERAASPGFESWWGRVAASGFCAAPVHLAGHDPSGAPVRVLGRCKNRRAAVCPSCSELYAGDTWHLVHAGITHHSHSHSADADGGGADGPHVSAGHPMAFATLTAPGFGTVHTRPREPESSTRGCHPTREFRRCPHGRPAWCTALHAVDDPRLGEPLCPDCYDYAGHVLFSWHAPGLWHRFTITLRRLVRRRLRDLGEDPAAARVAYVKVVELQRRGVPHFHAVIRLDAAETAGAEGTSQRPRPPQTDLTAAELVALVQHAVTVVHLDVPGTGGEVRTLRFGSQIDVQPVHPDTPTPTPNTDSMPVPRTARRVAGYLAKYVTKSVAEFGLSTRRLSVQAIERLEVREHVRAILRTIAELAELPGRSGMVRWLHTLGYRGHITTKTRRYSTTMGALRARREAWRHARGNTTPAHTMSPARGSNGTAIDPARGEGLDAQDVSGWVFTGSGHRSDGERLLAISAAARARENREAARAALADQQPDDDSQGGACAGAT